MNSRKEMIPAPDRKEHHSIGLCNPEWRLLCRLREQIKILILARPMRVADFRRKLKGMLAGMDDVFDFPKEDPK